MVRRRFRRGWIYPDRPFRMAKNWWQSHPCCCRGSGEPEGGTFIKRMVHYPEKLIYSKSVFAAHHSDVEPVPVQLRFLLAARTTAPLEASLYSSLRGGF